MSQLARLLGELVAVPSSFRASLLGGSTQHLCSRFERIEASR